MGENQWCEMDRFSLLIESWVGPYLCLLPSAGCSSARVNVSLDSPPWPLRCLWKSLLSSGMASIALWIKDKTPDCCLQSSPLTGLTPFILSNLKPISDFLSRVDSHWHVYSLQSFPEAFHVHAPPPVFSLTGFSLSQRKHKACFFPSIPSSVLPGKSLMKQVRPLETMGIFLCGAGGAERFSY